MSRIRQGGGFGFIVLLVVLAVILLLTSRAWKTVMPSVLDVAAPAKSGRTAEERTPTASSPGLPPPSVNSGAGQPPLQSSTREMKKNTDVHSDQVQKALQDQE